MANIFEYNNYRDYLKQCFEESKHNNPQYSYQSFSRKMGFNNRGFLFNVMKGKKTLSLLHCYKLSKALKHTREEADYFKKIVAYTQAKNEDERTYILEKIYEKNMAKNISSLVLGKEHYEYLSRWYHSAVRSLIEMFPMGDDYEFLSRKIFPPITVEQAKKSVELLKQLKIIRKGNDGIYYCTGKSVRTGDELSRTAINRFHVECTELAKQSIIHSISQRHLVSSLTLGISEKTYDIIRNETIKFKKWVIETANNDEKADHVYQYQLVLFPLTSSKNESRYEK